MNSEPGVSGAAEQARADEGRAVGRSSAALLLSRALVSAMGWAGSILIARLLGAEAWGQFSFVFGVLGLLSVVTDLGVGRVVLGKLLDPDPAEVERVATSFLALRVLLGLLGYGVAMAYVVLLGYDAVVVRATAVAGVVVVVATPSHALSVLFQSRLRMTVVAGAEALGQLVQLVLTVLVAVVAPVLLLFVIPFVVNEIACLAVKVRAVRRRAAGPVRLGRPELWRWRQMVVDAVPLTIGVALTTLIGKIDLLLLGRLDTFQAVGLYAIGYKFADVVALAGIAIVTPVMTLMVAAWPHDPGTFRLRTQQTGSVVVGLAALVVATFWSAAGPVIRTLYGAEYGSAVGSARLVVLGGVFSLLTTLGFTVLVAAGRHRLYPWVGLAGLTLNVGLNLVLIPRFSFPGAAWATVITEVVLAALIWLLVARTVPVRGLLPLRTMAALVVVTGVVVAVTELVADTVPWPVRVVAAALAVLAACWALDLPGLRAALLRSSTRGERRG